MSGCRSYASWSKGSIPSYSGKKESACTPKYESGYARSRPEAKKIEDKSPISALGGKYSAYSSGYQRDPSVHTPNALSTRTDLSSRYKTPTDKKDTNHPPVTYRPLTRATMSRSRDPSPVDKDKTESNPSNSYNLNRLYPKSYSRSGSREATDSITSTTTIPKYTGRSSINKEDKYPLGRSSRNVSKEDLSSTRYKGRTASKEDLSKTSQKYITSRFLPKNSVEKSYTAYTRLSSSRTSEVSRKNRELLNVLSAQNEDKSRPVSRCSSIATEEFKERPKSPICDFEEYQEMESLTVITRSTSPNPAQIPSQTSMVRTRRVDNARLVEKQITRLKKRPVMLDKEVQSDRLDDTTKNSRFAGASRIAAPWSSYLDLKYSSPGEAKQGISVNEVDDKSPVLSRNSSSKSLSYSSKSETPKESKLRQPSQSDKSKSKLALPKSTQQSEKKQLPPQVPKVENSKFNPLNTPNKDFRKSVLNMNTDKLKKKGSKRSNSVSSADSDGATSEASENLSSCKSFPRSPSVPKIPQKHETNDKSRRFARSPSFTSESSAAASSSEDDAKSKLIKPASKLKKLASKNTSVVSGDELDRSPKPPLSPRIKAESPKTEAEAKSFLMRALAPVTNLFKTKHDSNEKINWMDEGSENVSEFKTENSFSQNLSGGQINENKNSNALWFDDDQKNSNLGQSPKKTLYKMESGERELGQDENQPKRILCRSESGEKAWWLEQATDEPSRTNMKSETSRKYPIKVIKHDSDKKAWLDENSKIPEGIQIYPVASTTEDRDIVFKIKTDGSGDWLEETDNSAHNQTYPMKIVRPADFDEKPWWLDENSEIPEGVHIYKNDEDKKKDENIEPELFGKYNIRHIDSGERAWWLSSSENIPEGVQKWETGKPWRKNDIPQKRNGDESGEESDCDVPLGDRASPEGLETPREEEIRRKSVNLFISKHTNIDDILGGSGQLLSPLMNKIFSYQAQKSLDGEKFEEIDAEHVKIHDNMPQRGVIQSKRPEVIGRFPKTSQGKLDDAALQLYKDGDYGSYLDLEASISEQQEEFEGFQSNKKNSIVLRTQLSVRVHTIIEKLLTSEGRELRRALFSLKQIFQEDKDLVHEFVQNDGLACLIKVGSEADQNYQNYILRALGQVMLYVDGMNGVMEHNQTIQWLYMLISSKFRLVVKTALKLLLVFVEYKDTNCMLLIKAVHAVDNAHGLSPWHNIMKLLKDFDSADTELLIYATTLINKCLNGIPDQDTYYDQTDALEEQGIEAIIQRYMSKPGTDLDLLQQFQIYEAVLQYEDGEDKGTPMRHLDESIRKTLRSRKSLVESSERRKSRRHSTGNTPVHSALNDNLRMLNQTNEEDDDESTEVNNPNIGGSYKDSNKGNYTNGIQQRLTNGNNILSRNCSRKDLTPLLNAVNKIDTEENNTLAKQPWILSMMYGKPNEEENHRDHVEDAENANENDRNLLLQLKKENTVKDLTQKLANQNVIHSPSDENKLNRIGDMSGLISKAKEGLAKSKSQSVVKCPTGENVPKMVEVKKSENELRWEELTSNLKRPLNLCDLDFTDLASDDETDVLAPAAIQNGIPPPPPPLINDMGVAPPPPPLSSRIPPPVPNPPVFNINLQRVPKPNETKIPAKKTKKTVKLFWKEVRDDPISAIKLKTGFIWDELSPVCVDTQKLEHLFESRAKDLISKKQQELNKNKEIIVLDPKRSNAINIGMTKLPPPRSIKTAILKMDATIMNREGIEKLLTMLPTEEERTKIQEAQAANPDLPLGSAEQFLLTLASISELPARLKLWAFKLDFENTEREIAEPLMDLKQGFEVLRINKTFRGILSTLLSIGNFLNGNEVKGFQIEYLSKVPEVKDTVHKHSLLHHLCHIVMEKFPDATDLYSEIGAITRASKVDFDELSLSIQRLEADCKASWDHLKLIAKHDGSTMMKIKMSDFLADCAERIILLSIIHRRVLNRFHKFLLWLGIPLHQISDTKPNEFCRVISEFALEYRTTRERVLQQLEKKANHRERNKTRGKMITETGKFCTKEDRADAELRQLLGSDISDIDSMQGTLSWRRPRRGDVIRSSMGQVNGNLTDGDDEILESLVKTATKGPSRTAPRERKRTRHADRKSLKRSRTRENNPFGSRDSP